MQIINSMGNSRNFNLSLIEPYVLPKSLEDSMSTKSIDDDSPPKSNAVSAAQIIAWIKLNSAKFANRSQQSEASEPENTVDAATARNQLLLNNYIAIQRPLDMSLIELTA